MAGFRLDDFVSDWDPPQEETNEFVLSWYAREERERKEAQVGMNGKVDKVHIDSGLTQKDLEVLQHCWPF